MSSLKEFLKEQAAVLQTQTTEAAKKRDEWLAAVNRLTAQIRLWLQEADPNHVLKIQGQGFPIREVGIGSYVAPGLVIDVGPNQVRVEPVARSVAGPSSSTGAFHVNQAFGRVDMTDGLEKFLMFRLEKEPDDRWCIIKQDGYSMRPVDRESFEDAFQSLLAG